MCTRVCVSSRCSLWLLPDSGTMVPSSFLSAVVEAEAVVEAVAVAVEAAKHECGRHQSMTALGNHLRFVCICRLSRSRQPSRTCTAGSMTALTA